MRVSVLIAFRGDDHRQRLLDYVLSRLARFVPDLGVVIAPDDGDDPFNKCQALNDAARRAKGDAFLVLDADTWVHSGHIRAAIHRVEETGSWARPYSLKVKLLADDTETILDLDDWDGETEWVTQYEAKTMYWPAPPFVIPRTFWDAVGGMDERFRGWGQEDDAFGTSVRALYGPPYIIRGHAVHLWHPRIGKSGKDLWSGQTETNHELGAEYQKAGRKADTMKAYLEARHG